MIITRGISPNEEGGLGAKLQTEDEVRQHRIVTDAVHIAAGKPPCRYCLTWNESSLVKSIRLRNPGGLDHLELVVLAAPAESAGQTGARASKLTDLTQSGGSVGHFPNADRRRTPRFVRRIPGRFI